jgi:dihydroflavonol-4-reductase
MKVLLTGADGMLGNMIVRVLLERGHSVRALILPGSPSVSLQGLDLEISCGNILKAEEVKAAIQGCDAVIHAAGETSTWPARSAKTRAVNIDGTRNVIEASKAAAVQRFIFIGSASSFGFGTKAKPGTEDSPHIGNKYGLDNVDSKYEGLKLVLAEVKENGFPAVVIAPTFMFGPFDFKPGSGRMILGVRKKQIPVFSRGGKNFVYSRDVAVASVHALTAGRIGECYIAGNANLSYQEIMPLIGRIVNTAPPRMKAPDFLIIAFGAINSFLGRLFRFEPALTYEMAKVSCDGQYFSCYKAVEELNMPQTDIGIAIEEAYGWFKANGYCE